MTCCSVTGHRDSMNGMDDSRPLSAATHFGRQVKKERMARGWSLRELEHRTGIDSGQWSRIEGGKRPPTERIAAAADSAFPERNGWFADWYRESRHWSEVPAGFRSWSEYEETAGIVLVWSPGIIHGLFQAEEYARALIEVQPGATGEITRNRVSGRLERQRKVIHRDGPAQVTGIIDELSLYRRVGSAESMAAQCERLLSLASLQHVTIQLLPAIGHPANASELIIADSSAYVEHLAGGYVYTDSSVVSSLRARFERLRGECYRVSESAAYIERMRDRWATGASPLTATGTAEAVSK
jgi:hypothetical protein